MIIKVSVSAEQFIRLRRVWGITGKTTRKKQLKPCKRKVVKILEITDIRVKKILTDSTAESKMKAVVSVTFDDSFVVHDIKIIEGQDKLFTAMPSRKTQEGEFKDIAHPINREMRLKLEDAIIAEYKKVLSLSTEGQ